MPHDWNDWSHFAAVADAGGFAAAERATGVPKSRLSRRVAELEAHLGTRLIQRTSRRFALTEVGQQMLHHAHAMRAEAEAAEGLAAAQAQSPAGTVRLSCPPALLAHAAGPLLSRFLRAWPQVRLHVQSTNANVDVWHGGVDVALRVRAQGTPLPREETVRPLALSPHVLVAAPALLTAMAPPARPDELLRLPTLALGNSPEQEQWLLHGPNGQRQSLPLHPRLVVDDMDALLCAALAGVGCAALPRLLAHDALASGQLLPLLPDWAPPPGQVQAAYASRRGMRPAVRQLLNALAAGFDELIAQGRCLPWPPPAPQGGAAQTTETAPTAQAPKAPKAE